MTLYEHRFEFAEFLVGYPDNYKRVTDGIERAEKDGWEAYQITDSVLGIDQYRGAQHHLMIWYRKPRES
jgi:hypothetical protein